MHRYTSPVTLLDMACDAAPLGTHAASAEKTMCLGNAFSYEKSSCTCLSTAMLRVASGMHFG